MNKIFIISTVLATVMFANSIGQDEQYTNTNDKSIQKSIEHFQHKIQQLSHASLAIF